MRFEVEQRNERKGINRRARNAVRHEEIRVLFYSQWIFSEAQQMFLIPFAPLASFSIATD